MDDFVYLINLYDYYESLLTLKQKKYFKDYYFNNLTLSEISENNSVSRNAVYKQVKDVSTKLKNYEEKLQLYQKALKIKELIKNIDKKTQKEIERLI